MRAFARLLDALLFSPQRSAKLALLGRYFRETSDPERGLALAALTGELSFSEAKPAHIRALIAGRVDPTLFALSYDFVGDLAETVALLWPPSPTAGMWPTLTEVVAGLSASTREDVSALLARWLDAMDACGRFALLKLITGALRVGVSARLAKTALSDLSRAAGPAVAVADIEEVWHGLSPPYTDLFAWLEGRGPRPAAATALVFRPMMLANAVEEADLGTLDPASYLAEWKWDGIRVQLVAAGGQGRIFSRSGDDISAAFPEIAERLRFDAVLDGELLVVRDGAVAPFNDLQQRLGRKRPASALLRRHPAHVRLYDILFDGGEDLRPLPFAERRRCLEAWFERIRPERIDLSPLIAFETWSALATLRGRVRDHGIEGLMLKQRDSRYLAGRPKGPWFKWKRDPLTADCVLMYAQRGHGKRSSFYSDFTFGCWRDGDGAGTELLPVGKAYSGFTDEELRQLDRWVRTNTVERFGPVRALAPRLVVEIAFDAVQPSSRHRSGLAMRFPRFHRIRWDKPAAEADTLATLRSLLATPSD